MTVQELIDHLLTIENKELPVMYGAINYGYINERFEFTPIEIPKLDSEWSTTAKDADGYPKKKLVVNIGLHSKELK